MDIPALLNTITAALLLDVRTPWTGSWSSTMSVSKSWKTAWHARIMADPRQGHPNDPRSA